MNNRSETVAQRNIVEMTALQPSTCWKGKNSTKGNVLQRGVSGRPKRNTVTAHWGHKSRSGRKLISSLGIPPNVTALGMKLKRLYKAHGGSENGLKQNNYVYLATVAGKVSYVGITNNPEARQTEHGDRFHLHVLNPNNPLSRIEVRGIEQFNINQGMSQNIAASIATKHTYYQLAVDYGREFMKWAMETNKHLNGI